MDALMLAAGLMLGMILIVESKGEAMHEWLSQTAIGALVGSGLSVWWRKAIRWQANLAAGFFIGWWGGDYLIALFGLPETVETARAFGSGLGLIGYSLMDGAMRVPWADIASKAVAKRLGVKNDA